MIRRFGRTYPLLCLVVVLLASIRSSVGAGDSGAAVMLDEDYFCTGASAELDKRVEGDAFLAGGRVAVRGPVKGDVALAGADVSLADTVGQDLYAAGGSVTVSAQVAGNARLAGAHVTISPRGGVAGKASVVASSLKMAGRVGRYLAVYAESVRIDGEVGGDVHIVAHRVEIGPEAKISGKLAYRSPQLAAIDPTALIAGGVIHTPLEGPSDRAGALALGAAWIWPVLLSLSLLLIGVIMVVAFPIFSTRAAYTVRSDPWKSLALGFCLLLCLPAAAILFMVTIVGIPLGIAVLLCYPVVLLLGLVTGALFIADSTARWMARRRAVAIKPRWRYAALAVSLMGLLLIGKIPLVGCVPAFVVTLFGSGAFWICAYRRYVQPVTGHDASPLGLDLV